METSLLFDGVPVPKVITYAVNRVARQTKVEYNANGDMMIDLVNRKHKLTVYLGRLDSSEFEMIQEATGKVFFEVTFASPYTGRTTADFHVSTQPAEIDMKHGDTVYYKALCIEMEER